MSRLTLESVYNKIIKIEAEKLLLAANLLSNDKEEARDIISDIWDVALSMLDSKEDK